MVVIREVMHCKPGKVRPMVEKFVAMSKLMKQMGQPAMRVMTDVSTDRYWTVIGEFEMESLTAFEKMMDPATMKPEQSKQFEEIMKGYHDLIDNGRREIYKIEG
jgi:hypothetical protein